MSATVLTVESAKDAKIDIIANGKGTQAVHDAVVAMRANRRSGTASTKTKATVSGSGKKPYRQKGTGRARAGYLSSPIRVGGGVVFGPHPRSYAKKVSKTVKRLAFRKALSARIIAGDVSVVDAFAVTELKTKAFLKLVTDSVQDAKKILIVGDQFDETTYKAGRNIQHVQMTTADGVNTEDLLRYNKILITKGALNLLGERTAAPDRTAGKATPEL